MIERKKSQTTIGDSDAALPLHIQINRMSPDCLDECRKHVGIGVGLLNDQGSVHGSQHSEGRSTNRVVNKFLKLTPSYLALS